MEWMCKMINVGIDLHTTQFTVCALTPAGEILLEEVYETNDEGYEAFIRWAHESEEKYGAEISMAIEATGNARYFRNRMQHEGFNVLVINTMKFKVIVTSAKKTDRHDAHTIAMFLSKDLIPESYLCDQETEELRKLIAQRSDLVTAIVKAKNKIHAHPLYTEHAAKTLEMLLDTVVILDKQVKKIEELIDEFIQEDEDVRILESIPGVGKITASTIKAYVGDISRFETYKQFSAYCGLTPFVRFSNDSGYTGHITKRGPKELRTAMVQVVMGMLRVQKRTGGMTLIIMYKKMKREKGSGKSIIAFARKLSRIIYVMLKTHTSFDITKLIDGEYEMAS